MKVLMINGSPHAKGNTYIALHEMEKIFQKEEVETEILQIGNKPIRGCIACNSCSETYFPFFFLCLTHSVSRYSICPLTERKSSSAQAAMASYSFAESLSGICFFLLSAISVQAA